MSWQEFINLGNVPLKYRDVNMESEKTDRAVISKIRTWLDGPFHPSLLLIGPPGRGKTYCMYFILKELLKKYHIGHFRFLRSSDIDERMRMDIKEYGSCQFFIKSLCEVKFLFIDDFGAESGTERAERNYYDLIDQRTSNEMTTIYSTNLAPENFEGAFGGRITSRLQECKPIIFRGTDLRRTNV